ncbi:cupin domain-containing protein [Ralstonia insidiosa]|uniref:Cupin domain-containing protein n=1 Tax=Ralstonia insidiosa TaxID=190721 RepID=A0A848P859_9RALS|nr:cupin domain-containing protein [Ralstonia insidiosa]
MHIRAGKHARHACANRRCYARRPFLPAELSVSLVNLNAFAQALPKAWSSRVLERFGGGNFKVLRMDGTPYPDEVHDYAEGLLVIDGELRLRIHGEAVTVSRGEVYVVPAGVPHSVDAGSVGTLVILDV